MAKIVRLSRTHWINLDNVCEIWEGGDGTLTVTFNVPQSVTDRDGSPVYEARIEVEREEADALRKALAP